MAAKVALVLGCALFFFLHYSAAQTTHIVGDSTGWRVPSNGAVFYTNWAANKTFVVGDYLVFNFTRDMEDVTRVPRSSFDSCSDVNEIGDSIERGPATIVLSSTGEYYFISSEDNQCQRGLKLAINVTAAPTPPSANAPPPTPGRSPVTYVVGDATGWTIPQGGATFYVIWAANKTFMVGDSLVFNFRSNVYDVVRVSKGSFDLCSDDDDMGEMDVSPATVVLSTAGEYYFISSEDDQCQQGQKLAINVSAVAPGPMTPPSANPPPPNARPPPPRSSPVTHVVGDTVGWTVPQGGAAFYVNWAFHRSFAVGDFLVFNFRTDDHDVEKVPKKSFDICSDHGEIGDTIESGPATIKLTSPGEHYYISSENNDCQLGQKLAINVTATRSTSPVTTPITAPPTSAPSSAPSPGGSPSTPGGSGPPNSSANTITAALSATLFGLVLNFF